MPLCISIPLTVGTCRAHEDRAWGFPRRFATRYLIFEGLWITQNEAHHRDALRSLERLTKAAVCFKFSLEQEPTCSAPRLQQRKRSTVTALEGLLVELAHVFQEVAAPVSSRVVYDAEVVSGWIRSADVLPQRAALFALVDLLVAKSEALHTLWGDLTIDAVLTDRFYAFHRAFCRSRSKQSPWDLV
mmetsp:Transcript_39022/g.93657  ORF Transcript_39022/g.93657 Transcript_39022/m.93657 type:complete len:187 (+) Transcript_39022:402-962(+)